MADVVRGERGGEPVPGRLAMLTGISLAAGIIPLPFVPDRVLRQIRGAIVHDAASRYGISLTSDAREALADPSSSDRMRAVLRKGAEMVVRRLLRRLGPLAPLSTAARSFEVFALGHLADRYFRGREQSSLRMTEHEARLLRKVIDEAILRALYPSTEPRPLLLTEGVEDLRDEFTRWIDTLLLTGATLPSYLERRLDAAFDEALARTPEIRG
jgi:uncharacterized protein (DUF697 family)